MSTMVGRVAQSVQRLVTDWTVRGLKPGGGEIFRTCPDRPWGQPNLCTMGSGSFLGVQSGRDVTLTPHPLLMPWSRKGRDIPVLPYGPYGLYRASVPVQGSTLHLPYVKYAHQFIFYVVSSNLHSIYPPFCNLTLTFNAAAHLLRSWVRIPPGA